MKRVLVQHFYLKDGVSEKDVRLVGEDGTETIIPAGTPQVQILRHFLEEGQERHEKLDVEGFRNWICPNSMEVS